MFLLVLAIKKCEIKVFARLSSAAEDVRAYDVAIVTVKFQLTASPAEKNTQQMAIT